MTRAFVRVAKGAGLPIGPRPLHGLRHIFATLALGAGIPVKVVSEVLGHASTGVTSDLYQHVSSGVQADATSRVAGLIRDAQ